MTESETITNAVTLANSNRGNQRNEPIRIPSNSVYAATTSAGNRAHASRDWFRFCFSLVKKVARVLPTNHWTQRWKAKTNVNHLQHSIEDYSNTALTLRDDEKIPVPIHCTCAPWICSPDPQNSSPQ